MIEFDAVSANSWFSVISLCAPRSVQVTMAAPENIVDVSRAIVTVRERSSPSIKGPFEQPPCNAGFAELFFCRDAVSFRGEVKVAAQGYGRLHPYRDGKCKPSDAHYEAIVA